MVPMYSPRYGLHVGVRVVACVSFSKFATRTLMWSMKNRGNVSRYVRCATSRRSVRLTARFAAGPPTATLAARPVSTCTFACKYSMRSTSYLSLVDSGLTTVEQLWVRYCCEYV